MSEIENFRHFDTYPVFAPFYLPTFLREFNIV